MIRIPLESSQEAADAIAAVYKQYDYPANPINAARVGWRAARLYRQQKEKRMPIKAKSTHPVPKVGDTVVLNDYGLEQIWNTTVGLAHMKTLRMKVTSVDDEMLTSPPIYSIGVDNPEIDFFLIDHLCFDIVAPG